MFVFESKDWEALMRVRSVMVAVLTSMLLFSACSLSLAAEKNKTILWKS